jgi:hypothetical protein
MAPAAMTERTLQTGIIDLARFLGFKVAHFRPAIDRGRWRTAVSGDGVGFPDLVLVGHDRVLYREVKVGRNRLSPEQTAWRDALIAAGCDFEVWTEADWPTRIRAQLERRDVPSTVAGRG